MLSASWRHPRRPAAEEERANDAGLQLQGGGRHLLDLLGEEVPPIGGVARVRAGPVWLRPRHSLEILATCGLLLAVAAAVVTVTRPALAVYLEGDTVHIGSLTLSHPRDNGGLAEGRLYTGPATLLMVSRPGGAVVASAVTFLGGQRVTGFCTLGPPAATEITESCTLHIGGRHVTCEDALRFDRSGSWQRNCSDGQRLSVAVPAGAVAVPMPFPLGR